jgi:replicative DNA helicase
MLIEKVKTTIDEVFYNLSAEAEVLGGILFENNSFNLVFDFLKKSHFYSPLHAEIYSTIEALINRRRVAEPMTVSNNLAKNPLFLEAGGAEYLFNITKRYAESSFAINLTDRAKLIEGLYLERRLIEILQNAKDDLEKNKTEDAKEKVEKLEKSLFDLSEETERERAGFTSLSTLFDFSIAHIKKAREAGGYKGVPSGFLDLDNTISGFQKSDLIIVAGRPSMGKTSFAIGVAINAAKFLLENSIKKPEEKGVIAIFSLEMSSEQLATRILSVFSGINSSSLLSGDIYSEELKVLIDTAEQFKNLPIQIDDAPAITISALRTRARRLKRQFGLKMIIVDYLQLLRSSKAKTENRVQEVSEITQGLKAIAKELNVPVIALSQLSRNVESREDKRPQLQDLRESGSIEQDADIVLFLYREEYYFERANPKPEANKDAEAEWDKKYGAKARAFTDKAEIIISKHRNGPVGKAILGFKKETTQFYDATKDDKEIYFSVLREVENRMEQKKILTSSANQDNVHKMMKERMINN